MLRNPDLAIPLYIAVVFSGILLSGKWKALVGALSQVKVV